MVTLEELKRRREQAAREFGVVASGLKEKREKVEVRHDIRKIKAATLRGRFGLSKEHIDRAGNLFKGSGRVLGKGLKGIAKGAFAVGQSANEYYAQEKKRMKRR